MTDIVVEDDLSERRVAAGLSATLLKHAGQGQHFLGFLSYRRRDALPLARWLRDRITGFDAPRELKSTIAAQDDSVGGKQNRAFLDMSYQKPNVDFWDEHIAASLCRSRTLILLQTPSVFEPLDGGEPNWCEREIETFLKFYGDPSRILVVMGPGAPIDRFPAPLERISARWDWVDLRFFSESALTRFRFGSQYDPQVAKVLAKIYDIADGDLPILNREFARARARIRRNLAVAACSAIVALSGLTTWALIERGRAAAAEQIAIRERDVAVQQRNAALVSQSRYLSKTADGLVADGTVRGAVALLREALPDKEAGRDRPLVSDAIVSAYKAIFANRERGRLDMPEGALAAATDGAAKTIVIATADRLFVRHGLTADGQQDWPHDVAAPARLGLNARGDRVSMIAAGGAVTVRDVTNNRLLVKHAGEGAGTRATFLQSGARLLISDSSQQHLHLIDVETGAEIASRDLDAANGKPIVSMIDGDMLAFIADESLMRLSPDDLHEIARYSIIDSDEYALALSADRRTLYLAAAKVILAGRIVMLDPDTLAERRSFGKVVWGAKRMAVSTRWNMLALHGVNGIDFFDTEAGERIGHVVTTFPVIGGRFIGGTSNSDYMAYGSDGSIRRWTPELGTETAAYMTIDGGAIQQLDTLPDSSGFISISDKPSITQWAFDTRGVSKEYAIPFVANGIDFGVPVSMGPFDFVQKQNAVLAAYGGNSVRRWNLQTGVATLIKQAAPKDDAIAFVAALDDGVSLAADVTGKVQVYAEKTGAEHPVGEIAAQPLLFLGSVGPAKALAVTKAAEPLLLDASDPARPTLSRLPALGRCPRQVNLPDFALCVAPDGHMRALRVSDGKLLLNLLPPPAGLNAAFISDDRKRIAIGDAKGHIEIRRIDDNSLIRDWTLRVSLSGRFLSNAVRSRQLSEDDLAKVRAGATRLDTTLGPIHLVLSEDDRHLAAAMGYGVVKLIDMASDHTIDFALARDNRVEAIQFSPHGQLLAVIEVGDYRVLNIYEVSNGERLARISLNNQAEPKLFALADGKGFVTIDKSGRIVLHPAFEQAGDFIRYLAKEFPEPLTPAQRRAFFIE